MNLLLWRHAEAQDGDPDLARELTARGRKQAEKMAHWLHQHLPERRLVLVSPAVRTRQTADALGDEYRIERQLAPGADVAHYLAAAAWPEGPPGCAGTVILVGEIRAIPKSTPWEPARLEEATRAADRVILGAQPTLGLRASLLLGGAEQPWSVRKGALWWLTTRERDGRAQVVLRSVTNPEQL